MSAQTDLWDQQLTDIYQLTNRPDESALTNLALRQATLRAHSCGMFARDLVVQACPNTDLSQSFTNITIDTTAELTRFRDVSMVQLLDVAGNVLDTPFVDLVDVGDIFEPGYENQGIRKQNIAWLAGVNLNIYCASGAYGANVSYYQAPMLTRDTYTSWIAQLFPDVIVWQAAQFVWNRTGNESKAKEAQLMLFGDPRVPEAPGLYQILKSNYLNTAGR